MEEVKKEGGAESPEESRQHQRWLDQSLCPPDRRRRGEEEGEEEAIGRLDSGSRIKQRSGVFLINSILSILTRASLMLIVVCLRLDHQTSGREELVFLEASGCLQRLRAQASNQQPAAAEPDQSISASVSRGANSAAAFRWRSHLENVAPDLHRARLEVCQAGCDWSPRSRQTFTSCRRQNFHQSTKTLI